MADTEATETEETKETEETQAETKDDQQSTSSEKDTTSSETSAKPNGEWREGIEDEKIREWAGRFTSPAEAAKTAYELRQKLAGSVTVPGEKATDEERGAFLKALGVPEAADGYEITLPDSMPEEERKAEETTQIMNGLRERIHAVAQQDPRPQAVAQAALDYYFELIAAQNAQADKDAEREKDEGEANLKKAWGADHERNKNIIGQMMTDGSDLNNELGINGDFVNFLQTEVMDGVALGNHPMMAQFLAHVGSRFVEDRQRLGMTASDVEASEKKLDELTEQAHAAHAAGKTDEAKRLFAERDKLSDKMYGTASADGRV